MNREEVVQTLIAQLTCLDGILLSLVEAGHLDADDMEAISELPDRESLIEVLVVMMDSNDAMYSTFVNALFQTGQPGLGFYIIHEKPPVGCYDEVD